MNDIISHIISASHGDSKTCMLIENNRLIIKPYPFAHSSMQQFFDDIRLPEVLDLYPDKIFVFKILYDAYIPSIYGGSSTCGIYATLNSENKQDFITYTINTMNEQMKGLNLEFKCLVKFIIKVKV